MQQIINSLKTKLFKINDEVPYKREIFSTCYETLKNSNLCLIGLRQIGKTTLMEQLAMKYYQEFINTDTNNHQDEVLYINLKSIFYTKSNAVLNKSIIDNLWSLLTNEQYKLILIDEIQELDNWTNWLQTIIDINKQAKFVVSGSNSLALIKETMVGRMSYINIDPLSYSEYKAIWTNGRENIEEYLRCGSFPKALYNYDIYNQYQYLVSTIIVDKVIMDDLNNNIDANKFKTLLAGINNYIGNEIIYSDIEADMNLSRQTSKEYIALMYRSRLVNLITKYKDLNNKRKHKVYFEDKSMIYHFNREDRLNNNLLGSLIENEVYLMLKRKYYYKTIDLKEICYYRNSNHHEVDFVLEREKLLVECKYTNDLEPLTIAKRLNKTINENAEIFKDFRKVVITKDTYREKVEGWDFVPFEYLLNNKYNL